MREHGAAPELDRMRRLLRRLGSPQEGLRFIHIAGTNGKGSTAAMLESILREAGCRTGLYTSPHLSAYHERIRLDGANISDRDFRAAAEEVRRCAGELGETLTEFEALTAMALRTFAEKNCGVVVLETGLGGRLDPTNVIGPPEAAVITNIGLEHTAILGDTLEKIAGEKAGILKPGSPAICYESAPEALAVLREACRARGISCTVAGKASVEPLSRSLEGQTFRWRGRGPYALSLLGEHQLCNCAVVLETVRTLRRRGWDLPESAVERGLRNVRWPGRFEVLRKAPPFIVDGAHNPQCAQALADGLAAYLPGRRILFLLGVLADKDVSAMLRPLLPLAAGFLCVTPDSPRALPADALAGLAAREGGKAQACPTLEDALRRGLGQSEYPVAACGSLYLAGDVRELFFRAGLG